MLAVSLGEMSRFLIWGDHVNFEAVGSPRFDHYR